MTIKELREKTGMSRVKFAEFLGIPYRTVQHWEEGTRVPPEYLVELIEYKLKGENMI